ncbi:MAG: carbohydrate ABC transporter permease [Propioniciclava sp.]
MTAGTLTSRSGTRRPAGGGLRHSPMERRDARLAWLMVTPLLVTLALVLGYPLVRTIWMSGFESTFISPEPIFVGLANYQSLIASPEFWKVARQSVVWTLTTVVLQTVVGIAIALLLNQRFVGRRLLRILVVVPWAMPGVLAGILWKFMYDPYLGLVNLTMGALGLSSGGGFAPLSDERLALFAIIVAAVWKGTPLSILMYLAALQARPMELMEAAALDGAGAWQTFRAVTLPSLMPVIQTTVLLTLIWTFNYFDLVFVMTGGGPSSATEIAPTYIYKLAFTDVDYGRSSAFAVVTMLIMGLFTIIYLRQLRGGDQR